MNTTAKQDAKLRSMKSLHGLTIGATDGDIGTVDEFCFDDASYTVRYVVVDTGGWLSGRKVLTRPRCRTSSYVGPSAIAGRWSAEKPVGNGAIATGAGGR